MIVLKIKKLFYLYIMHVVNLNFIFIIIAVFYLFLHSDNEANN